MADLVSSPLLGIGALAKGLQSGFDTYQDQSRYNDARKRQKDVDQRILDNESFNNALKAKSAGLIPTTDQDEDTGLISRDPNFVGPKQDVNPYEAMGYKVDPSQELKKQYETKQIQSELSSFDPTSPQTQQAKQLGAGTINALSQYDTFKKNPGLLAPLNQALTTGNKHDIDAAMESPAIKYAISLTENQAKAGGSNREQAYKDQAAVTNKISADKNYQKYDAQTKEAENLQNVIDSATTNPAAANAVGVYAARYASGGSRINRQEIEALGGGSKAIMDRLGQIYDTASKGTLSAENANFMKKFVDLTSKTAASAKADIEDKYTNAYARAKGIDPEDAAQVLLGRSATQKKQGLIDNGPQLQIPKGVDPKDWSQLSDDGKQTLIQHLGQ